MSSPTAEFYASCSLAGDMLYISSILEDLGYPVENVIETDSSSGKSIALRRGLGRVRHLDVRALWLQQLVAARAVQIQKIPGAENRADFGTKLLDARTLRRHLQSLGMRRFVNGELLDI